MLDFPAIWLTREQSYLAVLKDKKCIWVQYHYQETPRNQISKEAIWSENMNFIQLKGRIVIHCYDRKSHR